MAGYDDDTGDPGEEDDSLIRDFDEQTEAGGWWPPEKAPCGERRAHPRVPFAARVETIPPDGMVHDCEAVNLSLGGVLLQKTDPGDLPELGRMVAVEIDEAAGLIDEAAGLKGIVVRNDAEARSFAVQFVNLEPGVRQFLADILSATSDD